MIKEIDLECTTDFVYVDVGGYGRFRKGEVSKFPERVAAHLIRTEDFKLKKEDRKSKSFKDFGGGEK